MSDPRFARLKSDPRFRRPRKQQSKLVLDERFKSVFESEKKDRKSSKSGRVDKYGRPLSETHDQDNLRRFYRLENEDASDGQPKAPDYARGEVLLESSDEDERDEKTSQAGNSDTEQFITVGRNLSGPTRITSDDEAEVDLDESRFADLDAEAAVYNQSHPEPEVEQAERTHRLAIVNLDWDHVRAIHLYKICSSLVSPSAPVGVHSSKVATGSEKTRNPRGGASNVARGRVLSVRIYPSEFGKERMAREEKEGPPSEVFKRKELEEEINEQNIIQVGDANEFDEDALRKYQLERLRYYYAIVTCDTVSAASHIYDELEGTELERSANVFDLSFVPDGMSFDDEHRDGATEEDASVTYKGVEFVTDALRHSKVKLTWDEDDPERNQVTRRTITKKELEQADFRAYLASSSSESESDNGDAPKRKLASRDALRSLLLGGDNDLPEGWDHDRDGDHDDVDMEVTFMPGLSESKGDQEQTSLDTYRQKMKEKRKKRKEELKQVSKDRHPADDEDDFFDADSDDQVLSKKGSKHRKEKSKSDSSKAPTAEELSLLVSSNDTEPQHFDLKSVLKAERKKKGKRRKGKEDVGEVQEDFQIDVLDERFKSLHEDHNFAIDPSNPHYKKTKAMQALLQQRSHRTDSHDKLEVGQIGENEDLKSLVENVKRKSLSMNNPSGKRRKLR